MNTYELKDLLTGKRLAIQPMSIEQVKAENGRLQGSGLRWVPVEAGAYYELFA